MLLIEVGRCGVRVRNKQYVTKQGCHGYDILDLVTDTNI